MFINVPKNFSKKDIKYHGIIEKDSGYTYILSDIIPHGDTIELKSEGFYSHVYTVSNSYLFIIGNQKGVQDIKPNKINFLNKILEFEYLLQDKPKKFIDFNIPNNIFTLVSKNLYQTFNERCLGNDLSHLNYKDIEFISDNIKIHLKGCEPLEKYFRYLCDNESGVGLCENGLSLNMLCDTRLKILKDTEISGYIIKYNHDMFN